MFPNTAYAKLGTGIPARDTIWQGLLYFLNAWHWDTATLVVIAFGIAVACVAREWLLALGILLNLFYVMRVGGDYMTSRFLTAAFFLCVGIVARYWTLSTPSTVAIASVIAAAGFCIPSPTITSARMDFGGSWPVESGTNVADQRSYAYRCSGLLRYGKHLPPWPGHLTRPSNMYWYSCDGPPVAGARPRIWPDAFLARAGYVMRNGGVGVYHNIGMLGYFAGPKVHVIDDMALGDALIARLPMTKYNWAAGHYLRAVPEGYLETGRNQIQDPNLAAYYAHLHTVIAGDLWSGERLKEVLLFQIGYYNHLLKTKR